MYIYTYIHVYIYIYIYTNIHSYTNCHAIVIFTLGSRVLPNCSEEMVTARISAFAIARSTPAPVRVCV